MIFIQLAVGFLSLSLGYRKTNISEDKNHIRPLTMGDPKYIAVTLLNIRKYQVDNLGSNLLLFGNKTCIYPISPNNLVLRKRGKRSNVDERKYFTYFLA